MRVGTDEGWCEKWWFIASHQETSLIHLSHLRQRLCWIIYLRHSMPTDVGSVPGETLNAGKGVCH